MKDLSNRTLLAHHIDLAAPNEIFRQVPKYAAYFCSNYGRLLHQKKKGYKFVQPIIATGGYITYTLSKPARRYRGKKVLKKNGKTNGQRMCITANRLVSLLFNYNPYEEKYDYSINDLESHHKDHNRQNNKDINLMWLASGRNGTRKDHDFINMIKKIALYNPDSAKYHTYKDIERLCKRIDVDILELIDILKDAKTPQIKDDKWTTYQVFDYFIGVQFYERGDRHDMTPMKTKKSHKNKK